MRKISFFNSIIQNVFISDEDPDARIELEIVMKRRIVIFIIFIFEYFVVCEIIYAISEYLRLFISSKKR